jgi:hypothetical protein
LGQPLDELQRDLVIWESYNWSLSITREEIASFKNATELVKSFGQVAGSDETFDVYRLKWHCRCSRNSRRDRGCCYWRLFGDSLRKLREEPGERR